MSLTVKRLQNIVGDSNNELHFYANGTTGDDTNDGLTSGTPKKTFQGVFAILPLFGNVTICIHIRGTFATIPENMVYFDKLLNKRYVYLDGGPDLTLVAGPFSCNLETLAGPYTADVHSTTTIGYTLAGWVTDAYNGQWVKCTSGPCSGQQKTIKSNTATTLTIFGTWSEDPGTATFIIYYASYWKLQCPGASWPPDLYRGYIAKSLAGISLNRLRMVTRSGVDTFDVGYAFMASTTQVAFYRPTTTIGDGSGACPIGLEVHGSASSLRLLRCTINDPNFYIKVKSAAQFMISHVVVLDAASTFFEGLSSFSGSGYFEDIETTPIAAPGSTVQKSGIGMVTTKDLKLIDRVGFLFLQAGVVGDIVRIVDINQCEHGQRCKSLFQRGGMHIAGLASSRYSGMCTIENSSGVGWTIEAGQAQSYNFDSSEYRRLYTEINNCTSHAVEVRRNGSLQLGPLSLGGSGNGGAGIYTHSGSAGARGSSGNSVTGGIGDFSINGLTQYDTWTNVYTYEPLIDITEMIVWVSSMGF